MRALALVFLALAVAAPSRAELPEMYRRVASVHWVVKDLDAVKAGWAKLGFPAVDLGVLDASGTYAGESGPARLLMARARLAGAEVVWVQPLGGGTAFDDHLARRGEGVMSLNYAAPSREALEAEVKRLSGLGVAVLQRGEVQTPAGPLLVVHMDTAGEGKYVLGLVTGEAPPLPAPQAGPPVPLKLSQYALVVRSLDAVSAYWEKLGFPKMDVTHGTLTDLVHRGKPGTFDQRLGWHRHGTVTWEWIEPLRGPTVYDEHLAKHGEGFHHLAFDVADMDAAIRAFAAAGVPATQSGGWGEKGKPGSGRFAYVETEAFGGVSTEFLWNHR
jgi:catechol 2,3-dioxygenase-like lactoylglutathione lyase family enzyme